MFPLPSNSPVWFFSGASNGTNKKFYSPQPSLEKPTWFGLSLHLQHLSGHPPHRPSLLPFYMPTKLPLGGLHLSGGLQHGATLSGKFGNVGGTHWTASEDSSLKGLQRQIESKNRNTRESHACFLRRRLKPRDNESHRNLIYGRLALTSWPVSICQESLHILKSVNVLPGLWLDFPLFALCPINGALPNLKIYIIYIYVYVYLHIYNIYTYLLYNIHTCIIIHVYT